MRSPRMRFAAAALLLAALAGCSDELPTRPAPATPDDAPRAAVEPYDGDVRIGVVPSASAVQVGATGAFEVREKGTGVRLLSGAAGETVTVTRDAAATVSVTSRRLQVTCTGSTATRDARLAEGTAAGFPTAAEYVSTAGCWRVYVGERPTPADASAEAAYESEVVAAGLATSAAFWRTVTLSRPGPVYRLTVAGGGSILSAEPPRVTPLSGRVRIAGAEYRGVAEVRTNAASALAGINELPMEEYLYGVVPRELGPVTYPEAEAQKAQAVAARTYAHANLGKRWSEGGYDMTATVSDQVYGGYAAEHPVSTAAVDATAGIVATRSGALISALYHATSGGHTASSEDVFSSALPYLRGVWDYPTGSEPASTAELIDDLANPTSTASYESWHHWHRWSFTWSMAEMSDVISAYAGQPVGDVRAIHVLTRAPTGRVTSIEYVTDAGTFTDSKNHIRSSLRYVHPTTGAPTLLPSTLFVIEALYDGSGRRAGYAVHGGGNGHGIGMSQTGAVGMARAGLSYSQILQRYYTGITLETKVGTR